MLLFLTLPQTNPSHRFFPAIFYSIHLQFRVSFCDKFIWHRNATIKTATVMFPIRFRTKRDSSLIPFSISNLETVSLNTHRFAPQSFCSDWVLIQPCGLFINREVDIILVGAWCFPLSSEQFPAPVWISAQLQWSAGSVTIDRDRTARALASASGANAPPLGS